MLFSFKAIQIKLMRVYFINSAFNCIADIFNYWNYQQYYLKKNIFLLKIFLIVKRLWNSMNIKKSLIFNLSVAFYIFTHVYFCCGFFFLWFLSFFTRFAGCLSARNTLNYRFNMRAELCWRQDIHKSNNNMTFVWSK